MSMAWIPRHKLPTARVHIFKVNIPVAQTECKPSTVASAEVNGPQNSSEGVECKFTINI